MLNRTLFHGSLLGLGLLAAFAALPAAAAGTVEVTWVQPERYIDTGRKLFGLPALVALNVTDYDVDSFAFLYARRFQHRVGLADAGGGAEEYMELAAVGFRRFRAQALQHLLGGRPFLIHRLSPAFGKPI